MPVTFTDATTDQLFVRLVLSGASGAGKTFTALKIAKGLGGKCLVIDTEKDTARIYANHPDTPKPYSVYNLKRFEPKAYILALEAAAAEAPNVVIVDSASHAWDKTGGVLSIADGDIRGWKKATPEYDSLVDALTMYNRKFHIIVTLRDKMEYSLENDPATGRMVVKKHGMKPIQRDTFTYEFDLAGDITMDHTIYFGGVGKSRIPELDGANFERPGADLAQVILQYFPGVKATEA